MAFLGRAEYRRPESGPNHHRVSNSQTDLISISILVQYFIHTLFVKWNERGWSDRDRGLDGRSERNLLFLFWKCDGCLGSLWSVGDEALVLISAYMEVGLWLNSHMGVTELRAFAGVRIKTVGLMEMFVHHTLWEAFQDFVGIFFLCNPNLE